VRGMTEAERNEIHDATEGYDYEPLFAAVERIVQARVEAVRVEVLAECIDATNRGEPFQLAVEYRWPEETSRARAALRDAAHTDAPEVTAHTFTEDVDDASMCVCGVPALTHDQVYPEDLR